MLFLLPQPVDEYPDWLTIFKSAPAGSRWITVHPNGKDEDGHAVLIKESATKPGTWHVIGGADGKLNHLTLDHVGSKADWDKRADEKRAKERERQGTLTPEQKGTERQNKEQVKAAKKKAKIDFVNSVAENLGWDKNWYKTADDYIRENPGISAGAAGLLAHSNLTKHYSAAKKEVARFESRLKADHEARTQAGLGDLSLDNNPYRVTAADVAPDTLASKVLDHRQSAIEEEAAEANRAHDEASAYQGIAARLATMPDDTEQNEMAEVLAGIGQPNTDKGRALFAKIAQGNIAPDQAAQQLNDLATGLQDGSEKLSGDSKAALHAEVADLYRQAIKAANDGDHEDAARYVEQAKKKTGDYSIGALDLVGRKAIEGKGYKPVERTRAREDVHERGEATTEALGQRMQETVERLDDLNRQGEVGQILAYGVNLELQSLQRAHDAASKGKEDEAADYVLEAQKYQVYTGDLAAKIAEGEGENPTAKAAGAIAAREKILASHAEVAQVKRASSGGSGGGGGAGGGGGTRSTGKAGGADLGGADLDMSKAQALLKAKGQLREREKQLDEAKRRANIDPNAFKTALKDPRVDEADPQATADAKLAKYMKRIEGLAESKTHADLIDTIENPSIFQAVAGEDQVRQASVAKWVSLGQDAMMQLVAQTAGDGMTIDRAKFALLGVKDGCALMAQQLANANTPERLDAIREGLATYHQGRAFNVASEALRAAETCLDEAKEFEMRGKVNAYDLGEMNTYNRLRMEAVDQALATVGSAYGELNATAEMIWALGNVRANADSGHTIQGGDKDREGLVVMARSLGLDPDEYDIQSPKHDPKTKEVTPGAVHVSGSGMGKVFTKRSGEEARRANDLESIKAGRGTADGKIKGDEEDYLPKGIARRPASTFDDPEKRPDQFDQAPDWKGVDFGTKEGEDAIRAHIGAKLANGMPVEQAIGEARDMVKMSPFLRSGKQTDQYNQALQRVLPGTNDESWHSQAHRWAESMAREHQMRTGKKNPDLHSQGLGTATPDQVKEAAHRALAQNPYGMYAFHKVGDLSAADQSKIREYAYKNMFGTNPDKAKEDGEEGGDDGAEPQADSFGNLLSTTLPQGNAADPAAEKWKAYTQEMGGVEPAFRAVLGRLKGEVMSSYAAAHGQVTGTALRTGSVRIEGGHDHYLAQLPEGERDALRQQIGHFTSGGGNSDRAHEIVLARHRDANGGNGLSPDRPSIGERAEARLESLWGNVAGSFTPGKAIDLSKTKNLSMSGRYVNQQRAIKAIRANKRLAMFLGVGSGKTVIGLGAFTDAHEDGEASHGLYAVPQNMVGQFGTEAATYLDPAKGYKWFAKPGASRDERDHHMGSKDHHFVVTTHQSLRDDTIRAIAEHRGMTVRAVEHAMGAEPEKDEEAKHPPLNRKDRAAWVKAAYAHKGWDHRLDYFNVDEGHQSLNRKGKDNSLLANVLDGISDNSKHYIPMTGTPVKNDLSEAYDWLTKLHPDKYPEEKRDDWLRNHGGVARVGPRVTEARKDQIGRPDDPKDWTNVALAETYQRAVAPHFFQTRVPLEQPLIRKNEHITLGKEHQEAYNGVSDAYARANSARAQGKVDVDAIRHLSPNSFAEAPEDKHEEIARGIVFGGKDGKSSGLPMARDAAYSRVLHATGTNNSKLDRLAQLAAHHRDGKSFHDGPDGKPSTGRPGIVFSHGLESVAQIVKRLKAEGHRVGVITGNDDAQTKEREKQGFQPQGYKTNLANNDPHKGAKYDILVCSDAVSAGADLPRAEWVAHYDIPQTAATHEQRTARAHRLSTEHPVEMTNLISRTPFEMANWRRLKDKYATSDVNQSPAEKMDDSGLQRHINQATVAVARRKATERNKPKAQPQRATGTDGGGTPPAPPAPAAPPATGPRTAAQRAAAMSAQPHSKLTQGLRDDWEKTRQAFHAGKEGPDHAKLGEAMQNAAREYNRARRGEIGEEAFRKEGEQAMGTGMGNALQKMQDGMPESHGGKKKTG